jgi:ribosomal protein S16
MTEGVEDLGSYSPFTKKATINKERVNHWLKVGAKASATVHNLLVREGVVTGKKVATHKRSKKETKTA